jgi:glutamine synthetase
MDEIKKPTADDVRKAVKDEGIEFLFANFVDMHARPSAKLIPAEKIDDLLEDGAGFAGFAAGDIGQQPNDPDMIAMPDVGSFTKLPWKPNVGWFAGDVKVEGEPWPYCPRTILRNQMKRCEDMGFRFLIGYELEYFLVRKTEDGGIEIADQLDDLEQPCYDIRALTRSFEFVSEVIKNVNSLGWGLYATDHEDANGQFEQNWDPADPLTSSDRAVFYRYMVEAMAQERGLIATFMPKPFAHLTGNGCHMHMSLWDKDGKTNVLHADPKDDSRGLGLSEKGYHFVGGLKKHAKSYIALTAPTVGSYKRLVIGAPSSGATWAPAYVTYGWNNRTMMLRIPDHGRIEDRTVDGACNPYLAATAVLAAGLDGIENGIDPGDPSTGSMYETSESDRAKMGIETLPANLLDATRELEQNEVMRKALGEARDEDYIDYFIRCKRREWQQAHEQITKWEIDRYLQLS